VGKQFSSELGMRWRKIRAWLVDNGFWTRPSDAVSQFRSGKRASSLGARGEEAAATFLKGKGYVIVQQNYQKPWGELDLIVIDDQTIVYVEVKTLRSEHGSPEKAVDQKKQKKLIRLAQAFAAEKGLLHQKSRFDIVSVRWPRAAAEPLINHFKNAFRGPDKGVGGYRRHH